MSAINTQPNSEQELMNSVFTFSDAGGSVIQIRTREPLRTATTLRKSFAASEQSIYREWDINNGWREWDMSDYPDHKKDGDHMLPDAALDLPMEWLRDTNSVVNRQSEKIHYFAFHNPQHHIVGNAFMTERFIQYAALLPQTNVCIILITPDEALSGLPVGSVLIADMKTPNAEELEEVARHILENGVEPFSGGSSVTDEELTQIAYLGLGLTRHEFETHLAISIVEAGMQGAETLDKEHLVKGISKGKTSVVKQSEILELHPSESMDNVGGMARLKDWLHERAGCYSEEAIEFGVEPPKGMVLVGVPGAGKSLTAKAASAVLGVPLVRMDFGKVFSKFVGDSESRVRAALQMVESMAPVVLFVDEIDKGLGGISGGSDSGTSSRVLGSFLTWLQDCKAPVFTMVTANRVEGLPPELLRRGRFDKIFSVVLPTAEERVEVLKIHMAKRNQKAKFKQEDWDEFVRASERYVPAEIESALKDALISAFSNKEALSMHHIVAALVEMVPMSKSHATQIDAIIAWASENATPVNYTAESEARKVATNTVRRISRPNRTVK